MKLVKAIKQLKFWSKKKKRKKGLQYYKLCHDHEFTHLTYNPSPPPLRPPPLLPAQPSSHCECHFSGSAQPSAPPLPPWLDYSSQHYDWVGPISSSSEEDHIINISQEPTESYPGNDLGSTHETYSSQQYDWGDHISVVSQEMSDSTTTIVTTESFYTQNDLESANMKKQSEMSDLTVAEKFGFGELAKSGRQQAENSAGLFGCVADVGALLFRCFRVSEYSDDIDYSNRSDRILSIADVEKKIE